MTLWAAVFGWLVYLRHARFATFGFDLGIFDQATWLLSEGKTFMTVRGLPVFGHHANLGLLLFVPAYRLGAGPELLNAAMVVSQALGALPVYLIARDRLERRWLPVALSGAYLLHPSLGFFAWETFHPEVMAITPLLFAWWFARRERWGWFAISLVYAASWKEDVALYVAALGVVLLVVHRRWGRGALTAAAGAAWFLFVNRWLLPRGAGSDQAFYDSWFGNLGSTPLEIVKNAIAHPTRVLRPATEPDAMSYYWHLVAPYALVPLLAPAVLLAALPQLLVNVLSVNDFTRDPAYHYAALPFTALTIAAVEGVALLPRPRLQSTAVLAVVASAIATAALWGISPIGLRYDDGWWPLVPDGREAVKAEAIAGIGPEERVSASYQLVPHLSQRDEIYEWPNPFVKTNWGIGKEDRIPEELGADVLVLDTTRFDDEEAELLDDLLRDEFYLVSDEQGVVVARRSEEARR